MKAELTDVKARQIPLIGKFLIEIIDPRLQRLHQFDTEQRQVPVEKQSGFGTAQPNAPVRVVINGRRRVAQVVFRVAIAAAEVDEPPGPAERQAQPGLQVQPVTQHRIRAGEVFVVASERNPLRAQRVLQRARQLAAVVDLQLR